MIRSYASYFSFSEYTPTNPYAGLESGFNNEGYSLEFECIPFTLYAYGKNSNQDVGTSTTAYGVKLVAV